MKDNKTNKTGPSKPATTRTAAPDVSASGKDVVKKDVPKSAAKRAGSGKASAAASATTKKAAGKASTGAAAPKGAANDAAHGVGLFQYFMPQSPATLADAGMARVNAPDKLTALSWPGTVRDLLTHAQTQDCRVWGLLPADFPARLKMTGADIRQAVEAAPGFDVYLLNPHIEIEAVYQNLWIQGDISHPQLLALSADVFRHAGIDTRLLTRLLPSDRIVTGHAVIATSAFWQGWLGFLAGFLKKAETLPDALRTALYQGNADPHGRHANGTFLTFVIERLLGEFVTANEANYKILRLRSPSQEQSMNRYLRDMRTLRDLAVKTGSAELAGIWSGYRKLYLTGSQGKAWMEQHGKTLDLLQVDTVKGAQ